MNHLNINQKWIDAQSTNVSQKKSGESVTSPLHLDRRSIVYETLININENWGLPATTLQTMLTQSTLFLHSCLCAVSVVFDYFFLSLYSVLAGSTGFIYSLKTFLKMCHWTSISIFIWGFCHFRWEKDIGRRSVGWHSPWFESNWMDPNINWVFVFF